MKEDSENKGKNHDDDGAIDDDAEENGLGDNEDFDGFDENEDVTSEALPIMGNYLCQVLAISRLLFEYVIAY